jgi:hypothetical protein
VESSDVECHIEGEEEQVPPAPKDVVGVEEKKKGGRFSLPFGRSKEEVAAAKKKKEEEAAAAKKKKEEEAAAAKKKKEEEAAAVKKKKEEAAAEAKRKREENSKKGLLGGVSLNPFQRSAVATETRTEVCLSVCLCVCVRACVSVRRLNWTVTTSVT